MSKCQEWRGDILRMCWKFLLELVLTAMMRWIVSALPSNFGSLGQLALEDRGGARYMGLRMELDKESKNWVIER